MAARKLGPLVAFVGVLLAFCIGASPAAAFSVGQSCTGNYTSGQTSTVICSGLGSPSQAVWVTVNNTGSVMFALVACNSQGCAGATSGRHQASQFPYFAASPGDSSFVAIPAGDTVGLLTVADDSHTLPSGSVAAQITGIYPQSSPPALAPGQVCSGGSFVPLQISCIWTGQVGAVTQNSWVTFSNTGAQPISMAFSGLHGSTDTQKLQPGQLAYVGVGAGHTTSVTQLELIEQGNQNPTEANPEVPPNPPAQVTIQSVVPENYSGFSLAGGQSCTTANFVSNPVQCAPSGQIGQGSSSANETVTITNTSGSYTALVGNDNGGGGLLTLGPGQSGTTSFDKNAQLLLTCLSGNANCSAGTGVSVKVVSATTASNAATLASPAPSMHNGRVGAKLRCGASKQSRCRGTITLRTTRRGAVLARGTFDLGSHGTGKVELSPSSRLPRGSVFLTITTGQPNGRSLVTDQRTVALKH